MTLGFKLHLVWVYFIALVSNGVPIYMRNKSTGNTYTKLARWKYDPWTDTKTLVSKYGNSECVLNDDGTVDDYSSVQWMYVSKSKRTLQKLKKG